MLDFIQKQPLLVGWLIFVVLIYLYVYLDYMYYRHNIKNKLKQAYEAITEEDWNIYIKMLY